MPNLTATRWLPISRTWPIIFISGVAGGLTAWLTQYFARWETLIVLALLGFWPFVLFTTLNFHFMALITFSLLGLVPVEPAPVDALSMSLLLIGLLTGKLSPKALTRSSAIHFTLWLFVVMNFVSLMVTPFFFESLRYVMITFYLIAFAYFIKMYINSVQAMRIVLIAYLVSIIITTLPIALGYVGVIPLDLVVEENRAKGLFKEPNIFGPFPTLMIVFLIDEIWFPRLFPGFNLVKVLGIIFFIAAIFLSFSRAALGNLIFSIIIYFVLNIKQFSLKRIAGFLMILALALLVLAIVIYQLDLLNFLLWRATPLQKYDTNRFATQEAGLQTGLTHLLGIGPGMLGGAHSLYVRTFAEYGFLGFISFFSCLAILSVYTLRRALRDIGKPSGLSAKVIFSCFVITVLHGLVIDTLHWRYLWFLFGLVWVVATWENPAPSNRLDIPKFQPGA